MITTIIKHIITFVLCTILISFIVLLSIPSNELFLQTATNIINGIFYFLPLEKRKTVINGFIVVANNFRGAVVGFFQIIGSAIVPFINPLIVKGIVSSLPQDYIDPEKCVKKEKDVFPERDLINVPNGLPWDAKLDYCQLNKGTLRDLDLDNKVFNQDTKLVLY